jgi:hypothetical protein
VAQACLNVMKGMPSNGATFWTSPDAHPGQPTKIDLCSVTQGERRSLSFLAQALGLMADLDFGKGFASVHLRYSVLSRNGASEMDGRDALFVWVSQRPARQ